MFHHVDAPEKIIHISDQAFFEAVDLDLAGLGPVRTAVQNGDFKGAFSAFWNYFLTREKPRDPFVGTRAELLTRISGNRELAEVIVGGGLHTFGQVTLDFSKQVDFNANFGDQSKYG
ncbi:MAG: hypothetical protein O3B73_16390, partial [bacterium]|nr:hypothetical protein [bacterium]